MRQNKILITAIISFLLLNGTTVVFGNMDGSNDIDSEDYLQSTSFIEPIYVSNNTDLNQTAQERGWPGNGSVENPYIIEGFEIYQRFDYCAYFKNITDHIVIKNCSLYNCVYGLRFTNVVNATVKNNDISSNTEFEIYLIDSHRNRFVNNYFSSDESGAVLLENSNDNIIENNTMECRFGIEIYDSSDNTVKDNNITSDSYKLIRLYRSKDIMIKNNNLSDSGIYAYESEMCTIKDNILNSSTAAGMDFEECDDNLILNNTIKRCELKGINLINSDGNTLTKNMVIDGESTGIKIHKSSSNCIINNTVEENYNGIITSSSINQTYSNNTIHSNKDEGLKIRDCDEIYIHNNTITRNEYFLYAADSSNVSFVDNYGGISYRSIKIKYSQNFQIRGNDRTGSINIKKSSDILIENNKGSSSSNAVNLVETDECIIKNNFFPGGIRLDDSDNNKVLDNELYTINNGIINSYSKNNTIINNKMKSGIYIKGDKLEYWNTHTITADNTVWGDSIYYWKNKESGTVPKYAGQVILANCTSVNITGQSMNERKIGITVGYSRSINISDNNLISNDRGVYLYNSDKNYLSNNYGYSNKETFYFYNSSDNKIEGNKIDYNNKGMYFSKSSRCELIRNNISNNQYGIYLQSTENFEIRNNKLVENSLIIKGGEVKYWDTHVIEESNTVNGDPLYYLANQSNVTINEKSGQIILADCSNVKVENQSIENIRYGIILGFSDSNQIVNNSLTGNEYGLYLYQSEQNEVYKNNISDSEWSIYLLSNNNHIRNNKISKNMYGLYLKQSEQNEVYKNTVSDNRWGIYLRNSRSNTFYQNNFLDNRFHARDKDDNSWYKEPPIGGNYWSDFEGLDEDKDGFIDKSYDHIGGDNEDEYPRTELYPAVPPDVTDLTAEQEVITGGLFQIKARATDNGELSKVVLEFYFDEDESKNVNMTKSGSVWKYTISVPNYAETLYYQLHAEDTWNKRNSTKLTSVPITDDQPPTAAISVFIDNGFKTDEKITFDASISSDNVGIVEYEWDFGDGHTSNTEITIHKYTETGNYTVKLTVKDKSGKVDTDEVSLKIKESDRPSADFEVNGKLKVGSEITFDASNSSDDTGIESYEWDFDDGKTADGKICEHEYDKSGEYNVTLRVTDVNGNKDTYHQIIEVDKNDDQNGTPGFVLPILLLSIILVLIYDKEGG